MGLVSKDFYNNVYYGEPISDTDFPKYEARAEDMILGLIHRNAQQVSALSEDLQTAIKKAICAQMDYFFEYGLGVSVYGKEAGGGFTVGKVSVNNGSASKAATGARSMIAPAVYVYLEQTGLINPSVETAPEPWPATRGWF
ncbi:MAG: hypothetical protein J6S14_23040 [Clostridia bacterium]|nr:hypothetical protein [Clostridia bacterium]